MFIEGVVNLSLFIGCFIFKYYDFFRYFWEDLMKLMIL